MRERHSLKKWLGGLAMAAVLAAGCGHYEVIDRPTVPLARFGSISMGRFTTDEFLASLRGSERYEKYLPVTAEANRAVYMAIRDRLERVPVTAGGPRLVLSANLTDFATGSGAARAMAFVGLVPGGAGEGVIDYHITLSSEGQLVASYNVRRKITGGASGAYEAEGADIVSFLLDNQ